MKTLLLILFLGCFDLGGIRVDAQSGTLANPNKARFNNPDRILWTDKCSGCSVKYSEGTAYYSIDRDEASVTVTTRTTSKRIYLVAGIIFWNQHGKTIHSLREEIYLEVWKSADDVFRVEPTIIFPTRGEGSFLSNTINSGQANKGSLSFKIKGYKTGLLIVKQSGTEYAFLAFSFQ